MKCRQRHSTLHTTIRESYACRSCLEIVKPEICRSTHSAARKDPLHHARRSDAADMSDRFLLHICTE